jgi:acetyl-CoA acetyltransferase
MAGRFQPGATVKGEELDFVDLYGGYVVPLFALVAQRHMHEYGTTPEQLATVSAIIRNNGSLNPEAVMYGRGPYTVDDVLSSPLVASPLHLLDTCFAGEGGAAFVLTSVERARDLPQPPVRVLGGGMDIVGAPYANPPLLNDVGMLGQRAATRAFQMAGMSANDLDVLCLYDPNSFEVIRQLEAIGLCGPGEGGQFAMDGHVSPGGRHPVNLDGGCLSYAWNGTQQLSLKIVEAVRQLRGTAAQQRLGAQTAFVSNAGAGAAHYEAVLLGRAS